MSLLGDLIGYISAGKAGTGLQNAYNTGAQNVGRATSDAITRVGQTLDNNRADLNNAAVGASGTVQGSADTANANIAKLFREVTGNLSPYLEGGQTGLQGLVDYANSKPQFNFDPSKYFNSAGYNFQLNQGVDALTNSASARGIQSSGAAAADLEKFRSGLTSTYYNDAYNQALNAFNTNQQATLTPLSMLANYGMGANQLYNSAAQNTNALQSGNTMNAGLFSGGAQLDIGKLIAGQNLQGSEYMGNIGLEGNDLVSKYGIGAANARAGQIMSQGNLLTSGITDLGKLIAGLGIIPGFNMGG